MEADFSGYVTKAGLKCTDGRTIMPDAFKHQDKVQVPLVWQHGHSDPENVLGHVVLEHRSDGVYGYGYFNNSEKANHSRELLVHKDINMMSIWANELVERSKRVLHGAIREVSLVLSGANPGALIENVTIRHSDDTETELEEEAIIYTGLELEHAAGDDDVDDDATIKDVYDTLTDEQKTVVHYMIGAALEAAADDLKQDNMDADETDSNDANLQQDNVNDSTNDNAGNTNDENDDTKGNSMKHNVFEKDKTDATNNKGEQVVLSHADVNGIVADAMKKGSLKEAVTDYALAHGITDIDILFPDAQAITDVPEWIKRRTEWVTDFLGGTRKSPFSRIKTLSADITAEEARAKGYITGNLKKEEFFSVARRVTTPTTVYKKQKLDRDDIVDITDFDVVAWLKAEMRLMLDEEIARAALVGDGRDISSEDKINEQNIRPISKDHELYVTSVNVNLDDSNSSIMELVDAIVSNRYKYKGSGLPTMYTTEIVIAKFLLLRDSLGRRIYKTIDELATELRVASVVPVEVMEEEADLVCILVNPVDYVFGATRGGEVSMFDDFDIDYNQYKYLIETRLCGALTKLKSAIVVRRVAGNTTLVAPAAPTFDGRAITIVDTNGVTYRNAATGAIMNAAGSPYGVPAGETVTVVATPNAGFYFATSDDDEWTFTNRNAA